MSQLPIVAFTLLVAAALLQALFLFRRPGSPDPASQWLLFAAAAALALYTGIRSAAISFIALTSTFESLVFWSAATALIAGLYRYVRALPYFPAVDFAATVAAIAMLAGASSPLLPKDALPPIPALRSGWLVLHVAFSFVGESFFVVSFFASLGFLVSRSPERRNALDRIAYTAVSVGYPVFTVGALVFGAVWAEQAWGRWWSWDPKETWALVTWLVYTAYLHIRLSLGKKGAFASWLCVIAFACTLFTFFGVNYLLSGLHSYG